jgi:hypothetical protein
MVKPTFEGSTFWTARDKAMHLLAILQGQVGDILHSVPAGAAYEDIITEELLRRPPAGNGLPVSTMRNKPVHEFASEDFIQRKAACAFVDGVKDQEVKLYITGSDSSLSKTLNQALKVQAAKVAARPPIRL